MRVRGYAQVVEYRPTTFAGSTTCKTYVPRFVAMLLRAITLQYPRWAKDMTLLTLLNIDISLGC